MENVLVTGGAGFIGSAVVRQAIAAGHDVVNVDVLTYAACLENLASIDTAPGYVFQRAAAFGFRVKWLPRSADHPPSSASASAAVTSPSRRSRNISRFRRVAGSRRRARSLLYTLIDDTFSGFERRLSVT